MRFWPVSLQSRLMALLFLALLLANTLTLSLLFYERMSSARSGRCSGRWKQSTAP